jgi:hypothetical protein
MMAKYQVSDNLLNAVIRQESGGNPKAVSKKGAKGLGQVMDATGRDPGYGVRPLQNDTPAENVRFTNDYLEALLNKYQGNVPVALAAYNAGPGAVDKAGGIPQYKETQGYVKNILNMINPINEASASETPYKMDPQEWLKQHREQQALQNTQQYKVDPQEWLKAHRAGKEQPGIMQQAANNLPADIKGIGEGTINMVRHPIDTLDALGGLPMGAIANMLPASMTQNIPQADKDNAANVGKAIKNTVLHPIQSFADKPASTLLNVIGIAGAGKNLLKAGLGKTVSEAATNDLAKVARKNALNAPKAAVLKEAQSKGFVVPKSEVAPSFINNRLEGIAGKAALNQESILKNQQAVSAQARKAIGLGEDVPITGQAIEQAIKENFKPYQDIAALPSTAQGYGRFTTSAAQDLKDLKQFRHDSQAYYKSAEVQGGNPELVAKGKALADKAKVIETRFEQRAQAIGKPDLVDKLKTARTNIAKIHSVDRARNVATGEIDPRILGAQLDKAPNKITGELKQIGEFQQAFPKYAKAGENVQTPGVSKIEAVVGLGGGYAGTAMGGPVGGFIGAMLPLASTPIRKLLLSKPYQNRLLKAMKANPSGTKQLMNKLVNSKNIDKEALIGLTLSDKKDKK